MPGLEHCFSPDYFTARDRFRAAARQAGGRLDSLPIDAKGPEGQELSVDIAWFGAKQPRRALVHSSGLHGVEGFAGSAIQIQLLNQLAAPVADTAVILVHILNPYGMAWLRRTNENNVDLNRNFKGDEKYEGAPPAYSTVDSFLNPQSPPASDFYYARAASLILRYGVSTLKQSIVGGQYEYSKGLFFGGKRLEQGPAQYESFLVSQLASVERLTVIDVHTGLGKFSEDSLLVDAKDYARFRSVFGKRVVALQPDAGPAYRVSGGLESMVFRRFAKIDPCFVCQEFGTYPGIKVLRALRDENRWHHYGRGSMTHPVKLTLKKTFSPDDAYWRQTVLRRGQELFVQALSNGLAEELR